MDLTYLLATQPLGWAELPSDILQEIADRLTTYEDFLSLKSVCHRWRFHYSQVEWTTNPQHPWLMLSEKQDGTARSFYSFDKNKHYEIKPQPGRGRRCFASPHGWIVTLSGDGEIHLLNPLSKYRKKFPRLSPSNETPAARDWFYFIRKLMVFKRFPNDFTIMAIYGSKNHLAFVRYGEKEWKTVREVSNVRDVALFEGQFYALLESGMIKHIKFSGPNLARAIFITLGPSHLNIRKFVEVYLVKSSLGDLLGVFRRGTVFARGRETTYFKVYKFNISNKKWKRLKDLGECAIFVGEGNSWSISASNSSRARNNMIYYADDYWRRPRKSTFSGLDIPFFSARDLIRIDAEVTSSDSGEGTDSDAGEGTDRDSGKGKDIDRGKGKDIDRGKGKDIDRGKGKGIDRGKGKGIDRGKGKDIDRGKGKEIDRGKGKDIDRGKGKEIDRGKGKEIDRGKGKDIDRGKGKDIDRGKGKDIDAGQVTDSDEEEVRVSDEQEVIYGRDIGVFSMASGKMELSRELLNFGEDIPCEYSRPIWFMPKLRSKFFPY